MELPGLSGTVESSDAPQKVNTVDLKPEHEWRFEVGLDASVKVKILSGLAEIFGTELAIGKTYTFTGTKSSVFTWKGCRIEWSGTVLTEYTSDETVMGSYVNLHFALEKLRIEASFRDELFQQSLEQEFGSAGHNAVPVAAANKLQSKESEGPKILIIGPRSSGKTSLAKILTAYAVKLSRSPIVVSLDPKQGMLSLPGTITAASFQSLLDVEEEWGSSETTGPVQIQSKNPITYYYGSDNPVDNLRYYKKLVNQLSLVVSSRTAVDHKTRISGTIIDAAGIIDPAVGYELIDEIVSDFDVKVIVTIGHERLYNDLLKKFQPKKSITVVKVPRSGGVVEHDAAYLRATQQRAIKEYFHGSPKNPLSAYTMTIDSNLLTAFKIDEQSHLVGSSILPIGSDEATALPPLVKKIKVNTGLSNAILAVLYAKPNDSEADIAEASVMGFIDVLDVDEAKSKLKVLTPVRSRFPTQAFLAGSYHFLE
ncbi:Pre-mRNA cleavage complex II protein Clp1-domain-containing protein [Lipomyces japonicus]|uniref:Pre-mRNA cleavage complex II protein Clp1-domain-containing protein n=1 Tax=Lipomyces japonicus TaxID=56871 RepID=UPI0034CD4D56